MIMRPPVRRRHAALIAASLLLGSAGAVAVAAPAYAATYTVDSITDDGVGNTLREAIGLANANPGADTIDFAASLSGQTITIDSVLIITGSLTISGLGSTDLSIARSVNSDVFAFQPTVAGDDFQLSGITIQGNGVLSGSGVVINDNVAEPGNATIEDVDFVDLVTTTIGGPAIIVDGMSGILNIVSSGFYANLGAGAGGAISATDVGTFISIQSSEFIGNASSDGGGGAVNVDSPSAGFSITETDFDDNEANGTGSGGAVKIAEAGAVNVTRSTFESNIAFNGGGGLDNDNTTSLTITDSLFFDSTSTDSRGGGVDLSDRSGIVTITGTTFSSNQSDSAGGGLATLGAIALEIEDSFFIDNFTEGSGGAIALGAADGTTAIARTSFTGNNADGVGGAIYNDGLEAGGEFSIHSSTFSGNDGDGSGNALALASIDGEATIINSTVDEAAAGIAVISTVFDGELRLRYSTIVGGVFIEANDNVVEVVSSILGDDANALVVDAGADPVDVSYSLLSSASGAGITDGGGNRFSVANLKLGPLQDNGGPTLTRMPAADSPAINAGLPGGTPPTFDQRFTGFPRVIGGRVDVGSVEAAAVLPPTGGEFTVGMPVLAGVLLLVGFVAVLAGGLRRDPVSIER
jgi:hypothetical protein